MLKITVLLILGLCSANLVYSDENGDSDNYIVDDLTIVLLEAALNEKSQSLQTYLDSLYNIEQVHFYSNDTENIKDQIDDTNEVFYGLIHKIVHVIHKGLDAAKNIVKGVTKEVENAIHGLTNTVKNVVHDATHLREFLVKRVKDLENEVKSAVNSIKRLPGQVIGGLKNALADARNILKDTLTGHIDRLKEDLLNIVKKLAGTVTAVLKAELEAAKKMLEGDLKAALEAWAIASLGPFGAALGELIKVKTVIDNYKHALLDKLNLAKQLKDKLTNGLKLEIDQHLKIIRVQYNDFTNKLHGQIDLALHNANLALGGVPSQIKAKVENAIDMVGQGLTQAKNRILDLQQQLQISVGDIKTKVQAELNDFMKQHGDVLRRTEQQLVALKAQVEAKLKTVQGALNTELVELQHRIDARLDELQKFGQQIGAKIEVEVKKVETIFEEMNRKNQDLHKTLDNLKNIPKVSANNVINQLNDVRDTANRMVSGVKLQLGGITQVLDSTLKGNIQILRGRLTNDVTNYLNSGGQVSSLMHSRLADLQTQFNKVIQNGGSLKDLISVEIQKQLEGAKVTLKATLNEEVGYINAKLKDIELTIKSVPADIKNQLIAAKNRMLAQLNSIVQDPIMKVVNTIIVDYNSLKTALEKTKQILQNPLDQAKKLGVRITKELTASVLAGLQNVQNQYNAMVNEIQSQLGAAVNNAIPILNSSPQVIKTKIQSVLDFSHKLVNEANVRLNDLQQQSKGATGAIKTTLDGQIGSFQKQHVAIMQQNVKVLGALNQQVLLKLKTAKPDVKPILQDMFNQLIAITVGMQKIH